MSLSVFFSSVVNLIGSVCFAPTVYVHLMNAALRINVCTFETWVRLLVSGVQAGCTRQWKLSGHLFILSLAMHFFTSNLQSPATSTYAFVYALRVSICFHSIGKQTDCLGKAFSCAPYLTVQPLIADHTDSIRQTVTGTSMVACKNRFTGGLGNLVVELWLSICIHFYASVHHRRHRPFPKHTVTSAISTLSAWLPDTAVTLYVFFLTSQHQFFQTTIAHFHFRVVLLPHFFMQANGCLCSFKTPLGHLHRITNCIGVQLMARLHWKDTGSNWMARQATDQQLATLC